MLIIKQPQGTSMSLPVKVYDNVLDTQIMKNLKEEIAQSNLNFIQEYPNRLFTTTEHTAWLINTFQSFIDQVQPFTEHTYVQQAFIGIELPSENSFSIHRSHPAIAGVIHISLEDHPMNGMVCLTDSLDEPEDYLWGAGRYNKQRYEFKENTAIVVKNSEPRHHWGFDLAIDPNIVKRGIWIYLGK